jgi:hypothetical protein
MLSSKTSDLIGASERCTSSSSPSVMSRTRFCDCRSSIVVTRGNGLCPRASASSET